MPEKITFKAGTPQIAARQSTLVLIPRRAQVLANLQQGEKLSVQVLEKFADGKVMLKIKGAAVTAQAKGDFAVGEQADVVVERKGNAFVLQRIDKPQAELDEALVRVVRARLGGFEDRSLDILNVLNGKAASVLSEAKGGLAGLIVRMNLLAKHLFEAEGDFTKTLANLSVLLGLSPASATDRISEALGRNLPGLLQRILAADKSEWTQLVQQFPQLSTEDLEALNAQAGKLKEQIGLFRALNGLFESRNLPLHLNAPFVFQGRPMPTELWVYKRYDAQKQRNDDQTTSAYIKVHMSNLGEVKALIMVSGKNVRASIYTERTDVAETIQGALPELVEHLEAGGLKPQVAVVDNLDEAPKQNLHELLYGAGEQHALNVKA